MSSLDKKILLIGYGSTLRGDDAVGRHVVEIFAGRSLPNVTTISVTQLVPELAAQIATAQAVIFVDASGDNELRDVDIREIVDAPGILCAALFFASRTTFFSFGMLRTNSARMAYCRAFNEFRNDRQNFVGCTTKHLFGSRGSRATHHRGD